ncbi:DUF1885 family protein [Paenibacillus sp. sptzw28]|uniref:DUF1885 family protein n=1 Tax=Paenibacillus sp. sptzw28 TaxID=715179 RepID=UPI001C6EC012|nr:DUF1885 family protein [Paenibacillus sp. sptzw28]QYR20042.1 DUF1885 family protein [Paenibacillus sp. sptzw28]
MSQSAYIKFVDGSVVQRLDLDEVKGQLERYREQTSRTGRQLGWDYTEAAFPYTVETKPGEEQRWFYLKGTNPQYQYILFGVGSQNEGDREVPFVQVVLPEGATHGDKSKGNELCKYLAKNLQAELTMFNGRTIYYNPRK